MAHQGQHATVLMDGAVMLPNNNDYDGREEEMKGKIGDKDCYTLYSHNCTNETM